MRIVAAHQNNAFRADADIIADIKLVNFPLRLPVFEAVRVSVQIPHNVFFKIPAPGIAVITFCTFDDDIGIFYRLMKILNF